MNELWEKIKEYWTLPFLYKLLAAATALTLLYVVYRIVWKYISRVVRQKCKQDTAILAEKGVKYAFNIFAVMYILSLFGINLNALLGAAGIAGVAVGFAAQTSFSNIISGFFMIGEHTIHIGDFIAIGDISGTVKSTDLLSVKIATSDNQLVRVPNETVIKSNLVNSTFFDTRRLTIRLSIAYDTDMKQALEVLQEVPERCPTVLKSPAPVAYYDGFGDSGIELVLGVWLQKKDLVATKNDVYMAVKSLFDEAGITIPYARFDIAVLPPEVPPVS